MSHETYCTKMLYILCIKQHLSLEFDIHEHIEVIEIGKIYCKQIKLKI